MPRKGLDFTLTLVIVGVILLMTVATLIILGGGNVAEWIGSQQSRQKTSNVDVACNELAKQIDQNYCNLYVTETDCTDVSYEHDGNHDKTAASQNCLWRQEPIQENYLPGLLTDGEPIIEVNGNEYNCVDEGYFSYTCPASSGGIGAAPTPAGRGTDSTRDSGGDGGDDSGDDSTERRGGGSPLGGDVHSSVGGPAEELTEFLGESQTKVSLFKQTGLTGERIKLNKSKKQLKPFIERSANVSDGYVATLWTKPNFAGLRMTVVGDAPTLDFNDQTSSVKISGGETCKAVLYERADTNALPASDAEKLGRIRGVCGTQVGKTDKCVCKTSKGHVWQCSDLKKVRVSDFNVETDEKWGTLSQLAKNTDDLKIDTKGLGDAVSAVDVTGGEQCQATLYNLSNHQGSSITLVGRSTTLRPSGNAAFQNPKTVASVEISESASLPEQTTRTGLQLVYDGNTYDFNGDQDEDAADWSPQGRDQATDVIIRQETEATFKLGKDFAGGTVTINGDSYNNDQFSRTFNEHVATYDVNVSKGGNVVASAQIKVAPPHDHTGTFRLLAVPFRFEAGGRNDLDMSGKKYDKFTRFANSFKSYWAQVSPIQACTNPSDAVEVITPHEQCANADEIYDACAAGSMSLGKKVCGPENRRVCGQALLRCAEQFAEDYNFDFDTSATLFNAPHMVDPTTFPRLGTSCSTLTSYTPDSANFNPQGMPVIFTSSWTVGQEHAKKEMSHALGHSYGLCYGRGETTPRGHVGENERIIEGDTATQTATKIVENNIADDNACPNNDPGHYSATPYVVDLMDLTSRNVMTPDSLNWMQQQMQDDINACTGNTPVNTIVRKTIVTDADGKQVARVDVALRNNEDSTSKFKAVLYGSTGNKLFELPGENQPTSPWREIASGKWSGMRVADNTAKRDDATPTLLPASKLSGGYTVQVFKKGSGVVNTVTRGNPQTPKQSSGTITNVCHTLHGNMVTADEITINVGIRNNGDNEGKYRVAVFDADDNQIYRKRVGDKGFLNTAGWGTVVPGETRTGTFSTTNDPQQALGTFSDGYVVKLIDRDRGVIATQSVGDQEVADSAKNSDGTCN